MPEFLNQGFDATVEVDGIIFKDVIRILTTYELNGIPSCTVEVGVGFDMKNKKKATIHDAVESLKLRSKAKVTLEVFYTSGNWLPGYDPEERIEPGKYVIFDGYFIGTGWGRDRQTYTYQLNLIHWLDDLNCSSMLNGNFLPGLPGDLGQQAVQKSLSVLGLGTGGGNPVGQPLVSFFPAGGDLWKEGFKPLFEKLAKKPHFREQENTEAGTGGAGSNDAALEALKKIQYTPPNGDSEPTLIFKSDAGKTALDAAMPRIISDVLIQNMAYSSFWSKLVNEVCAEFVLAVSPAAEGANVIPYFSGLRKPWKVIKPTEYSMASFNCAATNLIESVNLFYPGTQAVGLEHPGVHPTGTPSLSADNFFKPFGKFPENNPDKRGFIMVKTPPVWLQKVSPQHVTAAATTLEVEQDAHSGVKVTDTKPPNGQDTVKTAIDNRRGLARGFCQHWFQTSILAQRVGEFSGRLRFDIAPGSILEIQTPSADIGNQDAGWVSNKIQRSYFGAVTNVTLLIDAEKAAASTTFTLMSMRTDKENKDNLLTYTDLNSTPLYTKAWPGGILAKKA